MDSVSAVLKGGSCLCCPGDGTGPVLGVSEKQIEWLHDGRLNWQQKFTKPTKLAKFMLSGRLR